MSYNDFNGVQIIMSLTELINKAAESIEKMPEAHSNSSFFNRRRGQSHTATGAMCANFLLPTRRSFIHDGAWAAVLALVAANPALAAVVAVGGSTFWWWISQYC